jgi:hypothetical protein
MEFEANGIPIENYAMSNNPMLMDHQGRRCVLLLAMKICAEYISKAIGVNLNSCEIY